MKDYVRKYHTLCLWIVFFLATVVSHAQTGIGTTDPHPSAALELNSTDKGLLIPRMTAAQRDAIPNPAEGLEVYVTSQQAKYYFDGINWERTLIDNFNANYQIYEYDSRETGVNTAGQLHQIGGLVQVFSSIDADYSVVANSFSIEITENGLYSIELTGHIRKTGNFNPVTARYLIRLNGSEWVSCYESIGVSVNVNNSSSVGIIIPPAQLSAGDILTLWCENVDGTESGFDFIFEESMITITRLDN